MCLSVGQMWAAEGDTHDFAQTLSQLLNNNAAIASITIDEQDYPVKKVTVSGSYNKTAGGATVSVTVGGETFGEAQTHNANSSFAFDYEGESAVSGQVVVSFVNNCGSGTGKGTFKVTNITLTEGAAATPPTPANPFTVTLMDNSATLTEETAGAGVTLPSREGCTGYTFAGWTKSWTAAQSSWTTTAPTIIPAGAYTPEGDENLYPVYTKTEGGGESWSLCSTVDEVTEGTYVITWDNSYYLPSETAKSPNPDVGSGITVDNNALTNTVTSAMQWTFTGNNTDGFAVSHVSDNNTYYLTSSNTAQGIGVTTSVTQIVWKASVNATYGMLLQGSDGGTRYLAVYNSGSWRYYATGNSYSGTLRLYKKSGGSTTSYISDPNCCTELGAMEQAVVLDQSSATLTWNAIAGVSAWSVTGNIKNGAAIESGIGEITDAANSKKQCVITGLSSSTAYEFQIHATIASGYCTDVNEWSVEGATEADFTIEAASNNTDYGTVSRSGNVITGAPAQYCQYANPAWTATPENSANVAQDGNTFTVTPSANTAITINFERIPVTGVSLDQNILALEVGGATATLSATVAPAEANPAVEWSVSPAGVVTVENGVVTAVAAGTAKVRATSTIDNTKYAECDVTVTVPLPTITITPAKIESFGTSYSDYDWSDSGVDGVAGACSNSGGMQFNSNKAGYYLYNTTAIPGRITKISMTKLSSGTTRSWTPYVSDEVMTEAVEGKELTEKEVATTTEWEVTGSNQYFYLEVSGGATILSSIVITYEPIVSAVTVDDAIEHGSVVVSGADDLTAVAAGTELTITATPEDANYQLKDYNVFKTGDAETKITVTNNKFIMPTYAVTVSAEFEEAKNLSSIAITTEASQKTFWVGEDFNYDGLVIKAVYDNDTEKENVTPKSVSTPDMSEEGVKTVTIAYEEKDVEKTTTYEITVKALPTEANPATVAEILDIYAKLGALENMYVRGTICNVKGYYSSKYISYEITDSYDAEEEPNHTNEFTIYNGLDFNGAAFSAQTDLEAGQEVVVNGNLTEYQGTIEFAKDNQIISRPKIVKSIALSGEYATEFTDTESFSHTGAVVTATYNYGEDADVTEAAIWSEPDMTQLGEQEVTVSYTYEGKTVTFKYNITIAHVCAQANLVAVTKGVESNGTFALSETEVCTENAGGTVVVSNIVPAEGYRFKEITSIETNGTEAVGTVTITENDTTVTGIDAATTITVVFEEIPSRTINYSIGGNAGSTTANEGTSILAALPANPTVCEANYTSFYGWASSAIEGEADEAPAILNDEALVSASTPDVTYYAVFTNASSGNLFTWEGGTSANLAAKTGVTLSGNGSDYGDNNAPYYVKLDGTGDYILIEVASQPDQVAVGVKMIGGANASKITVQEAVDKDSEFTDVEDLTISGSQNDVLNLETSQAFAATTRAIKLYFTKGSNVGVGPISIEGVPATAKYVTTCPEPTCESLAAPTLNGDILVDYQSALIAWNEVENASSYVLNIMQGETPVIENASITDLSDLSYLVENLDAETTYSYSIMAVGNGTTYCAENNALLEGNFTTEAATPAETATLTLSENGTTHDYEGEYILGQTIQLPDAADCSKVFVGWSANAECAVAPEYEAGDDYTLAATTQTLYAVYATEGAGASSTLFSETFDGCTNTGGNDGSWSGSIANGTLSLTGWTCVKGSAADACAKFGTTSALGSAQTPAIEVTGAATLTFRAGAWNGNSENTNLKLSATGATLDKSSVALVKGAFTEYTVAITEANGSVTIKFEGNSASNSRFFLDDVVLSQSAITYSEYSTTCEALLAAPTFSLAEQEEPFTTAQTVELAATEGTIYYTLDGTTPTNESTKYTAAIELNNCGEYTIKAIAISATSHSAVVSASYTINIPLLDNSELIPYTPAQAIEVFDGGCYTNEKVYVKGVVKTSSGLNTTYGNYDNIVVVAEETTAPEFTFFHMYKGASKTQFDANDPAIVAGDTIVAYGELTKYGQIYEFKDGCYLIDRKAYAESKQSIANDIEHPYTLAEAIEFLDNPTTYDLSEEVYVKGVATTAPNVNNTFTAHDPEVENVFQFYTTNLNDLTVGVNDTIIVKGLIKKVNANYRMESGVVQEVKAYVAHTISVNPSAVAFDEVEQNASVDAIEFDVYLTHVASATVTLGGTNASAFSIGEVATLTENGKITVSVVSTDLEIGGYAATITISDDADVAEDVVVNVTMTIIATDSRHKAFSPTAGFTATSGDLNPADITYASAKGDGTADPNVTDGKILYYQPGSGKAAGGYMTLTAVKGCTIDQVKVVTAENNATSIKYSKDGGDLSEAKGVEAGANYLTPASLNAQTVNIYCAGADKNHRLYVEQVVVYYTGEAMPVLSYSVDASGVVTTEFPMNGEFSSEGLKVYACYDATCDDKVDITNQCNVVADLSSIGAKKAEVYLGEEKLGEYDINVVEGRENPALAYTPASATIGAAEVGGWTAPVLSNPFQVTPIYSSNNEAVATVTTEGVITLAGGYGTVVIKATFAETEEYIASEATYTLTISEPINKIEGEWHKATSTTDLAIGAKIIFVGAKNNTKYAMGAQNNNNRAAVAVVSETDGVIAAAEGTKTFTLVDAGDGKFAFRANNGKYLYAAGSGSGSNYLREQTTLNGDAMWTITYDANGAATIQANGSHTNNMLRFNTSLLFSCYASGQAEAAIYVNSKEYAGSNDPENPANVEVTTNVVEEEIVANGNIVLTVNANTFQEPKTYVAQNGATIIINNSGTETEAKSVIVDENSTIEIQKPTTVNEYFYVAAKKGQGTTTSSTTASQINNADKVHVASPGHFDFTLAVPGNIAKDQWHDFSVPFPVNATTGVLGKKNGEWQALEYNVDYAIMYHRGDKRANKEKEWYWCTGVMQPGKLYSLTVEGSVVEFRFVKTNDAYDLESQDVTYDANAEGAGNADDDYGWNALGTTKLNGAIIAPNGGSFAGVYVLLNTNEGYGQVNTDGGAYKLFANLNEINLMLGSAFFIQVSDAGSIAFQAPGAGVNYAPARMESESNGFEKIKVTLSDGNYTDNLYLSASEDAENRYERGKDLVKKFATATPIVPTLYTTNYGGKKLGVEYAPLTGNTVNYALTLFAPKAGEYTIAASQVEGEIVYLTYNGSIIWNLSMNEYTVDLNQGTDELYGIRVVKAPQVITGIENGESAEAGVQKVVIDQNVYILRNKQMYDVTGKAVK